MNYTFLIANKYHLDIKGIILNKLKKNAGKYPVCKAKGKADKYTELSAHAKCSIIGDEQTMPITNGRLNLITWKEIFPNPL